MTLNDTVAIVTIIVAVAGLVLSIYNIYVSRRDKKPKLLAKIYNGFLTYGPDLSDAMLLLEVANPRETSVKVTGVQVVWGKQTAFFPGGINGTERVPFDLSSGTNAKFWTPLKEFAVTLQRQGASRKAKVKACFTDAIGNYYYSKEFAINIDSWTKH